MDRGVNPSNRPGPMDRIADLIGNVRMKGVSLWSANGQLHYRAPKGALTQDEIEALRVHRAPLVSLLETASGALTAEPRLEHHPGLNRAPLAFSQLAHWNLYQLNKRPSSGMVSSALHMRGRLNIDALRKSVAEVIRRHDALRTRIVVCNGVPIQEVSDSSDCATEVDDLTELPEGLRGVQVKHLIERYILRPINVTLDALCRVHLLKLGDEEHVLIVVMEHMISDGFSLNVLFRDLFTTYTQVVQGRELSLPVIPVQFADYSVWQRNEHESWMKKHHAYWDEHLKGCRRVWFPETGNLPTGAQPGLGNVRFKIGRDLKAELLEWCRQRRTTLVMGVFTAYVALVLRWCNASEAVFLYETDGRVSPKIESTIGYFAFPLYLRIALFEDDRVIDLLDRVTDEYCKAYEHADFSYMESQVPKPEFTRNSCFNWLGRGARIDLSDLDGSDGAIVCSEITFEKRVLTHLERDSAPYVALLETDEEILGWVQFSLTRLSFDTMEAFARNLVSFIRTALCRPEVRVKDILIRR